MSEDRMIVGVAATVSSGGRIRIPQRVLNELGIKDGEQVVFFIHPEKPMAIMARFSSVAKTPEW
jgi:bifunctional DNA-binding transcriptional regulator/antitoxin component of YhaV-PrlF toxin-antitoxin module